MPGFLRLYGTGANRKIAPHAPANAVLGETDGVIRLKFQTPGRGGQSQCGPGGVSGRNAAETKRYGADLA
jgi:hypothetical protein